MIKEKITYSRVTEIILSFKKTVFVAERNALTYDKKDNDLVGTFWISEDPKEIFNDIFPEVDVYLDDGKDWDEWLINNYCMSEGIPRNKFHEHWKSLWHVGKWIDCEGFDWAEEHPSLWVNMNGSISREDALKECHEALIQAFINSEIDMLEWSISDSNNNFFLQYLQDGILEIE